MRGVTINKLSYIPNCEVVCWAFLEISVIVPRSSRSLRFREEQCATLGRSVLMEKEKDKAAKTSSPPLHPSLFLHLLFIFFCASLLSSSISESLTFPYLSLPRLSPPCLVKLFVISLFLKDDTAAGGGRMKNLVRQLTTKNKKDKEQKDARGRDKESKLLKQKEKSSRRGNSASSSGSDSDDRDTSPAPSSNAISSSSSATKSSILHSNGPGDSWKGGNNNKLLGKGGKNSTNNIAKKYHVIAGLPSRQSSLLLTYFFL